MPIKDTALERWRELSPLLDELLDLDRSARFRHLAELENEDPALARTARELLAREGQTDADLFGQAGGYRALVGDTLAGKRVGDYTLVRPLGEGGMGTVWLARRSDGRYEGQAAVKFPQLHMLGPIGLERFRREGHLLARLAHPGIAGLIDAGLTSQREPYLVLEYVQGEPLDCWCDTRALDVAARIRLFLDVLAAVAHAHTKLVLHRDLKPSNILVAAEGQVKLLDFGIAKLLQGSEGAALSTELTEQGGRAFTPEFAAPEQMRGMPVAMATDVYSLGVILFRLLAHVHPIELDSASPVERARRLLAGEARRLRDAVPLIDEQNLSRRSAKRAQLARTLRGDLETIVGKSLKPDLAERYATVDAFAEDLRRYLARQPVKARPDTFRYRAGKFVSRNRYALATGSLVFVALLTGLAGTIWQSTMATLERDRATAARTRAEAFTLVFASVIATAAGADEPLTLRELLKQSENAAMRDFRDQPHALAAVLESIAQYHLITGDAAQAEPLLERAATALTPADDPSLRALVECALADLRTRSGEAMPGDAERTIAEWLSRSDVDPASVYDCRVALAHVAQNTGDRSAALVQAREAERVLARLPLATPSQSAHVQAELASGYQLNGLMLEADQHYARAMAIYREVGQDTSYPAMVILNNWAATSSGRGDIAKALELSERAIALASNAAKADDPPAYTLSNRARYLGLLGRSEESLRHAERAVAVAVRKHDELTHMFALLNQAAALLDLGELERAEASLDRVTEFAAKAPSSEIAYRLRERRAKLALLRGDPGGAHEWVQGVIAAYRENWPRQPLASALRLRAEAAWRLGRRDEASNDVEEAIAICRAAQGNSPHSLYTGLGYLLAAGFARDTGDLARARSSARAALSAFADMLGPEHPDVERAHALAAE